MYVLNINPEKCKIGIYDNDFLNPILLIDEQITQPKLFQTPKQFGEFSLIFAGSGFCTGNYHGVFAVGNSDCCNADAYFGNGFTKRVNISCGGYTYKYCSAPSTSGVFVIRIQDGLYRLQVFNENGEQTYIDDWGVGYNRISDRLFLYTHGCDLGNSPLCGQINLTALYDRFLTDDEVLHLVNIFKERVNG